MLIGIFILAISLPALFGLVFFKNPKPMYEELRLSAVPTLPESLAEWRHWPRRAEDYYRDHFGFRFRLLSVYRHLKYFIGDPPTDTALFGRSQGWIFYNDRDRSDVLGDYRNINQFSETDLEKIVAHLEAKQRWFAERGIHYLFVIAPSKHYIYPQQLPAHITRLARTNVSEQLAERLARHPEVHFLHLKPVLQAAAAASEQLLYYKADSHWNMLGANVAQYAIATSLQPYIAIEPKLWSDSEFSRNGTHRGDLSRYMGLEKYFSEVRPMPELPACATALVPPRTSTRQTFATFCDQGQGTAMVFRDSFFTNLQPFISSYFQQATYVWEKLDPDAMPALIEEQKPVVVIEQWVDRHLPDFPGK